MKTQTRLSHLAITLAVLAGFGLAGTSRADITVYANDFNSGTASLNDFTVSAPAYNLGSYSVDVVGGQLAITTYISTPTAAFAAINTGLFGAPYSSVLKNNPGKVTWAFNVSNQDGVYNNLFYVGLASSGPDAQVYTNASYVFAGGGYVGDQMNLYRNVGPYAGLINVPSASGLGALPSKGSFRITYEPANNRWQVFGYVGADYVDPTTVTTLLGTAFDSALTGMSLPFLSLGSSSTGTTYYDNLSVTIVPEPSIPMLWCAGAATWIWRAGQGRTAGRRRK